MAESITEGTLNQFSKQVGDFIELDEELATIETDKIDVSVNAPQAGVIQQLLVGERDTVTVDQAIAEIQPGEQPAKNESKSSTEEEPNPKPEAPQPAKGESVEPSSSPPQPPPPVNSTPEHKEVSQPAPATTSTTQQPLSWGFRPSRVEERVKMIRIRQRTAQKLKESQNTAAFLTTFNEVDMTRIIECRKKNQDAVLEKRGVKLGFMGSMARASSLALKEIPSVNASIKNNDTIVYRDYVDLSVAAAIPKGLVTPVLRNIESMSIMQIEKGIGELVKKARDGKLTMNDLTGGSFTISNSGIWGSLFGTPILNTPQTAVLGTYGIQDRPVAVDGRVEIRPMMYIALTYDHRIVDGREAVRFLNLVKKYLQDPETMLLE
ncbi:hypothetical protein NUU61_004469 [Penicillium alfredii]|uniref:dihydrolipoyllysine-residue succinyltransferase n=1 Tax=Penicillium alfredii TaxID=1506179 RepID=A0A9W9FLM4_9EURO|nr:uncharacterized protein NUU61_004469 [Penicillium alfredii]KAJ5102247.1 hypothetical protein NUU61_004469 [Penicillium alfredii]